MVGNYTLSTLPRSLQEELSFGLVRLLDDGTATAGAALSWSATDSGKVFIFKLNPSLAWQDGRKLESGQINYNLKGVEIQRPDAQTIVFNLKEPFSPLVNLLSQPLFKNGLVGLGENRVTGVKFNGRFLASLTVQNVKSGQVKLYKFYPSEKDLVTALRLGAVRKAAGLHSPDGLVNDPYYHVTTSVDNNAEAVIFFNTAKSPFEDKTFRQGLVYALPDSFSDETPAASPFPNGHWAQTNSVKIYSYNPTLAKKALEKEASGSAGLKITLTSSKELLDIAKVAAAAWEKAGIKTEIVESPVIPVNFDAYLAIVDLPSDPDQYALWHSTQTGNIAAYKSFKVDKLLEEGRRTVGQAARLDVYRAFEKAITEDVPAAFLFYPKVYTILRG